MKQVLLVIFGEGGHRAEMLRLLADLNAVAVDLHVVSLGVKALGENTLGGIELAHYPARDIRSKHSRLQSLLLLPSLFSTLLNVFIISRRYQITGVISTGPGIAIMPMFLLRLMGVKGAYIESFCMFHGRTYSGRVMSRLSNRFLIQNKELHSLYPNSEYSGRL